MSAARAWPSGSSMTRPPAEVSSASRSRRSDRRRPTGRCGRDTVPIVFRGDVPTARPGTRRDVPTARPGYAEGRADGPTVGTEGRADGPTVGTEGRADGPTVGTEGRADGPTVGIEGPSGMAGRTGTGFRSQPAPGRGGIRLFRSASRSTSVGVSRAATPRAGHAQQVPAVNSEGGAALPGRGVEDLSRRERGIGEHPHPIRQEQRGDQTAGEVGLGVDAIDRGDADALGAGRPEQRRRCWRCAGGHAHRDELVVSLVNPHCDALARGRSRASGNSSAVRMMRRSRTISCGTPGPADHGGSRAHPSSAPPPRGSMHGSTLLAVDRGEGI